MKLWEFYVTKDILRLRAKCWFSQARAWIFGGTYFTPKLVPNPLCGLPRNMICPLCQSGNKFKKCCSRTIPREVLPALAAEARFILKAAGLA